MLRILSHDKFCICHSNLSDSLSNQIRFLSRSILMNPQSKIGLLWSLELTLLWMKVGLSLFPICLMLISFLPHFEHIHQLWNFYSLLFITEKRTYNGLPDFMTKVAREELNKLSSSITECNVIYLPQVAAGFLPLDKF